MSHDLDMTNGRASMAYVGAEGTPWHGLGVPVERGISAQEMAKKAGLNWPVLMEEVQFDWKGQLVTDPTHQVMFRGDTGAVLDITGSGYVPHQNIEVLEFFQEYVTAGEMFIDTAGAINNGRQIWVLAKMEQGFQLPGKDRVEGYVMLMNPHIYGKGMIAKFCATRVVCRNTILMALSEGGMSVKIWHTKEFNKARQEEAKQHLGIARERLDAFKSDAKVLAELRLDQDGVLKVLAKVFNADPKKQVDEQPRVVQRVIELFHGAAIGAKLTSADGTGWGLLNACTQYIDHEYGRSDDSRLTNAWLGTGDVQKRKAMAELLVMARG